MAAKRFLAISLERNKLERWYRCHFFVWSNPQECIQGYTLLYFPSLAGKVSSNFFYNSVVFFILKEFCLLGRSISVRRACFCWGLFFMFLLVFQNGKTMWEYKVIQRIWNHIHMRLWLERNIFHDIETNLRVSISWKILSSSHNRKWICFHISLITLLSQP